MTSFVVRNGIITKSEYEKLHYWVEIKKEIK